MMVLDCPACLDEEGAVRCGLPAEVRCQFTTRSSDGPAEAAMIRCPARHWFNGPIQSLTREREQEPRAAHAAAESTAACRLRDRPDEASPRPLTAHHATAAATAGTIPRHTCPDRGAGPADRHPPRPPEQETPRPNTAPARHPGRPAWPWLSATKPRRRPTPLAAAQTQTGGGTQPANPVGNTQPKPPWVMPQTATATR
jgi:hypothetical protein